MSTKTIPLVVSLIVCLSINSFSQDTISSKYFPLNVGNKWIYNVVTFPPIPTPIRIYSITKDTVINNHRYFLYGDDFSQQLLRYDSSKGNLLAYSFSGGCSDYGSDKIVDSLSSSVGDEILCQINVFFNRTCTNIGISEVFNVIRPVKRFEHDGLVLQYIDYAQGLGIVWTASGEPPPANNYEILKGCIINGIVYGDTNLTSVKQTSSIVPGNFSLSQNYPNPFNPNTIINFQLSMFNNVRLIVYDVLGNEVAVLVNEKLSAGSYSVDFDGSKYSSGVYFYKLEAGEFVETKRMALIK
ncbi:MAG: T9SS type A sorting domain-containing protein [Bacteroidota bacterium]|nr:T9SS type A sorting domain-containing protein [Bacteroidota bacterium]